MQLLTETKIAAAAIKMGTEVYTGRTHFEAMHNFLKNADLPADKKAEMLLISVDGFITDDGEFLDRSAAFEVAAKANQLINHEYSDPEKNKAFFQTDKPSLDSGLVAENYAPLKRHKTNVHVL